jgi:hypothetical protein
MDDFVAMFLVGEALQRILVHSCNHATSFVNDPVTDIVSVMLTTPVCPVFSTSALMMFRDHAHISLPYTYMTDAQRAYVHRALGVSSKIVRRNNCVELNLDVKRTLPPLDVLFAMCSMVLHDSPRSSSEHAKRMSVANVLLQRVRSAVYVTHDVFVALQARLASL